MMILKKLAKYLEPMGLSINSYFNMAVRQLVIQKKFPLKSWLNKKTLIWQLGVL